jgi:cytochrome c oxidase subunit 3
VPGVVEHQEKYSGEIPSPPNPAILQMGMWLFLASLGIFFVASVIGIVLVRNSSPNWGEGTPSLPDTAWISTGLILLLSVFSQLGVHFVRQDAQRLFRACMLLVFFTGFAFLFSQEQVWEQLLASGNGEFNASSSLLGWCIYALGLIHALHLAGGLVFQSYVTVRSMRGGYWSLHHELVKQVNLYWHFLGVVWFGLFAFLLWLV